MTVRELEADLSRLSGALFQFIDHPACEHDGLLVDLATSEGDIPLGVWWSDREDTPKVRDLARLIEALRATD